MLQLSIVVIIAFLCSVLAISVVRARHDRRQEWPELIAALQPIDTIALDAIAMGRVCSHDALVSNAEILCNGSENVRRLMANAEIVLHLALYARRWSPNLSIAAVYEFRRPFATILILGYLSRLVASVRSCPPPQEHLRSMAQAYTGMVKGIEVLYATIHVGRYPALRAALHAGGGI